MRAILVNRLSKLSWRPTYRSAGGGSMRQVPIFGTDNSVQGPNRITAAGICNGQTLHGIWLFGAPVTSQPADLWHPVRPASRSKTRIRPANPDRSRHRTLDFTDPRGSFVCDAKGAADRQSGCTGRCFEPVVDRRRNDAPVHDPISGDHAKQKLCNAQRVDNRTPLLRHSRHAAICPHS